MMLRRPSRVRGGRQDALVSAYRSTDARRAKRQPFDEETPYQGNHSARASRRCLAPSRRARVRSRFPHAVVGKGHGRLRRPGGSVRWGGVRDTPPQSTLSGAGCPVNPNRGVLFVSLDAPDESGASAGKFRARNCGFLSSDGTFLERPRRAVGWRGREAGRRARAGGGPARTGCRRGGGMRPTSRMEKGNRCCAQPIVRRNRSIRRDDWRKLHWRRVDAGLDPRMHATSNPQFLCPGVSAGVDSALGGAGAVSGRRGGRASGRSR